MAKYDFRILFETVQGAQSSYYSSSFVDTSVDLVLSSSQVYNRITGSVSCSYQNKKTFNGTIGSSSFVDNTLLSASLSGSLDTGSIIFTSLNDDYDRLKRYKFYGEKVCSTLGLPHNQWIFVDQFRLAADDEDNYIEGNINAKNIYISDNLSFANKSTINTDIPIFIDTGSDRHIKFIDVRGAADVGLFMGYDKDEDFYEIGGSADKSFKITNVDRLRVDTISGSTSPTNIHVPNQVSMWSHPGSNSCFLNIYSLNAIDGKHHKFTIKNLSGKVELSNESDSATGFYRDIELRTENFDNAIHIDDADERVGIGDSSPSAKLDVGGNLQVQGDITASGDISSSGTYYGYVMSDHPCGGSKTSAGARWLGFGPTAGAFDEEDDTDDESNRLLMPFDGYIHSIRARSESAPGNTIISFAKVADGTDAHTIDTAGTTIGIPQTINMSSAHTMYTFTGSKTVSTFSAGDMLAVSASWSSRPDAFEASLILMFSVGE